MGKTLQNKCFKRNILKCPQSFRECCAIKAVSTFLDESCQKCWFSAKFWIWALVAAFFPFEIFYYWCAQIQASNFMSFPKRTLKSEKFHVDLGVKICWPALFCVGFLTTTVQKWSFRAGNWIPVLAAFFFKNKPGTICPGQKSDSLSENLPLETAWARKCDWNSTKRKRWTRSKRCFETVPNTGKRTKPQFFKMTWRALHTWMILWFFFITFCPLLK